MPPDTERLIEIGAGFKLPARRIHAVYDLRDRDPSRECLVAYYSIRGDRIFHRIAQRSYSELVRELADARRTTFAME